MPALPVSTPVPTGSPTAMATPTVAPTDTPTPRPVERQVMTSLAETVAVAGFSLLVPDPASLPADMTFERGAIDPRGQGAEVRLTYRGQGRVLVVVQYAVAGRVSLWQPSIGQEYITLRGQTVNLITAAGGSLETFWVEDGRYIHVRLLAAGSEGARNELQGIVEAMRPYTAALATAVPHEARPTPVPFSGQAARLRTTRSLIEVQAWTRLPILALDPDTLMPDLVFDHAQYETIPPAPGSAADGRVTAAIQLNYESRRRSVWLMQAQTLNTRPMPPPWDEELEQVMAGSRQVYITQPSEGWLIAWEEHGRLMTLRAYGVSRDEALRMVTGLRVLD